MKLPDYYRGLTREDRLAFASKAETTCEYIEIHLLAADEDRRKTPRKELMNQLVVACGGHCSFEEVVSHFFQSAS